MIATLQIRFDYNKVILNRECIRKAGTSDLAPKSVKILMPAFKTHVRRRISIHEPADTLQNAFLGE